MYCGGGRIEKGHIAVPSTNAKLSGFRVDVVDQVMTVPALWPMKPPSWFHNRVTRSIHELHQLHANGCISMVKILASKEPTR